MKIAWCLFGQPRLYKNGFINILNFINKYPDIQFDFFFHCWFDEKEIGNYYDHSYRNPSRDELLIKPNTDIELLNLYKPKKYLFEKSKTFNTNPIQNSKIHQSTKAHEQKNYNNVLSNFYSKYTVNNLLQEYINNNNEKYDLVISTRFDYLNNIVVDIKNINQNKLNIVHTNEQRIILNDSYIITNPNLFDIYSKAFINLSNIINNIDILNEGTKYETTNFVPESLLTLNLIYSKIDVINTIEKRKDMLNFTIV